jgi:hypothetical protein
MAAGGLGIMSGLARTVPTADHKQATPQTSGTRRGPADEALVRLYIRFSDLYAVFVAVAPDRIALVSKARDPNDAVEKLRVVTGTRLELVRVWWTQSASDAAVVHLAFAGTPWPPEELIPALLTFAREGNIPLTSDSVVQAKARNLVEWVDADFESLRSKGGLENCGTAFVADREALTLRRSKIRALYRVAQAN